MSENNQRPKNFSESTQLISNCVTELDLPEKITEQAKQIYLHSYRSNIYRGRCKDDIIAASIYAGTRITEESVNTARLAEQFDGSCEQSVFNTYLHLVQSLGLPIPPESVSGHITQIADELKLCDETVTIAQNIHSYCKEHSETYTSGKSIIGIASAAIYNAVDETSDSVTQKELSDVSDVTPVTIRNRYKEQQTIIEESNGSPPKANTEHVQEMQ